MIPKKDRIRGNAVQSGEETPKEGAAGKACHCTNVMLQRTIVKVVRPFLLRLRTIPEGSLHAIAA